MIQMIAAISLSLTFAVFAQAQQRPVEYAANFEESDFETKPYMKDYEFVIVVNKATEGSERQSIKIYRGGHRVNVSEVSSYISLYGSKDSKKRLDELIEKTWSNDLFMVSTGRDAFERKGEHGSQKDSWTVTPAGYFSPQYFAVKHRSQSYSKKGCGGLFGKLAKMVTGKEACAIMENAIFFNGPIALHKAIPGTEWELGRKASGGCVRLSGPLAEYLFTNVQAAIASRGIPRMDNSGNVALDLNGQTIYKMVHESIWGSLSARSALIIVQNKIVE